MTDATFLRYDPETGTSEQLVTLQYPEPYLLVVVHQLPLAAIGLSVRPDHEYACMPKINRMAAKLRGGGKLPPVIVHPAGAYFACDDGYHRLHAYSIVGVETVPAIVWSEETPTVRGAPGRPFRTGDFWVGEIKLPSS